MNALRALPRQDRKLIAIVADGRPTVDLRPPVVDWNMYMHQAFSWYRMQRTSYGKSPQEAVATIAVGTAVVTGAATVGYGAVRGWQEYGRWKWRRLGVAVIPMSVALTAELSFPVGHPRVNCAYAANEFMEWHYYPIANYHAYMLSERLAQMTRLLRELGAVYSKVQLKESSGLVAEVDLKAEVPLLDLPPSSTSLFHWSRDGTAFLEQFYPFSAEPVFDPESHPWIAEHPSLVEAVIGRLERQSSGFSVLVSVDEDYGVTSRTATQFEKVDVDIGGKFQRQRSVSLEIQARF